MTLPSVLLSLWLHQVVMVEVLVAPQYVVLKGSEEAESRSWNKNPKSPTLDEVIVKRFLLFLTPANKSA